MSAGYLWNPPTPKIRAARLDHAVDTLDAFLGEIGIDQIADTQFVGAIAIDDAVAEEVVDADHLVPLRLEVRYDGLHQRAFGTGD